MNGIEIRALRTRLGLTQKALAEIVGVNSNTVARWERGELGISPAMTDRLSAAAQSLPSGAAITRISGVVIDPHHREILNGLNGSLDPQAFEKCAVDLLQVEWPGLVPIRGGQDDGFDGAVADGASQEPFPLIVTTGAKLAGNLRKSLDSAMRAGWKPQRALFATSRRIKPAIRRKLFEAARQKGVTLVQAFDQDWFAGRLYREPQWCKRLLGVTGRPHALSVFPVSRRPVLGDEVLGRDREMKWLQALHGDRLLVGEPGSGKTFLLRALALQERAFFLVDEDREQIANDLRTLKPEAVIVDDAHVRPTSIGNLDQLRSELHADFRIIATCWPGETERVQSDLRIGHRNTLTLDRIDADTMIEIIKSVGIQGPNELLYAIRSQAAGRPGLAVTLSHLCIIGDVHDAANGVGLVDSIAPDLDRVLGIESMRLLAPFALGGDAGVRKEDVAERLGMSLLKISSALTKLGAAGVIRESGDSAVSVEPSPMRWVLVQRVFFGGPGSLSVDRFLSAVRSRTDFLETLIGARARGANAPNLERLLEEANSNDLWAKYALVGPETAHYALARHPEIINDLAEPALVHLPEKAISLLLSRIANKYQTSMVSDSMLRPLKLWIERGNSRGWSETVNRRQTLLRCTESWWQESRNTSVAIAAMCLALNSNFDFTTVDPGAGTSITFNRATVGAGVILPLATSWPAVMTIVNEGGGIPWTILLELVETWCHPQLIDDEGTRDAANQFLSIMLNDLTLASRRYPGVQHRIVEIAKRAEVAVRTTLDAEFECLYPQNPYDIYDVEDLKRKHQRLAENARGLAMRWRNRAAVDIARFLGRLESEACRASITYPRLTPEFCRALATEDPDPVATLRILMHERLPADLVEPFLSKAYETGEPVWTIVSDCFDDELYVVMGVMLAISSESAPLQTVLSALSKVGETPRLVDDCCTVGEVSQAALSEMFRSPNVSTAISAAIGHWKAFRHSRTEIKLNESWRRAFLRSAEAGLSSPESYWTGEILRNDADLAVEWLVRFLDSDQSFVRYHAGEAAKKVIASLNPAHTISILTSIQPRQRVMGLPEIIDALVDNNADIYRQLLRLKKLTHYHLSPLLGKPNGDWRSMAILALDRGYSCKDVVGANLAGERSWAGNESEMWAELRCHYEDLQNDDDCRIAEVGEFGTRIVAERERRAKERERDEAIYGLS